MFPVLCRSIKFVGKNESASDMVVTSRNPNKISIPWNTNFCGYQCSPSVSARLLWKGVTYNITYQCIRRVEDQAIGPKKIEIRGKTSEERSRTSLSAGRRRSAIQFPKKCQRQSFTQQSSSIQFFVFLSLLFPRLNRRPDNTVSRLVTN